MRKLDRTHNRNPSGTTQIGSAAIPRDLARDLPCGGVPEYCMHHPTVAGGVDRGLAFIGRDRAECANNR